MVPVPTHLVAVIARSSASFVDGCLDAKVQCPCGSDTFELLYPGQTHEVDGQHIPCTAEMEGKFFFRLEARCTRCSGQHLLFDADFHGWDGFVCHDSAQASLPRPQLQPWACLSCRVTEHKARVRVYSDGEEDFVENTDGEFEASCWIDAFGWFSMDITCTKCGTETAEWVSYETA
jgi:hypothetical protein